MNTNRHELVSTPVFISVYACPICGLIELFRLGALGREWVDIFSLVPGGTWACWQRVPTDKSVGYFLSPCGTEMRRRIFAELLLFSFFSPGIFQRDGAVENGLAGLAVFVESEIGQAFELVAVLWSCILEARLALGGHYFE